MTEVATISTEDNAALLAAQIAEVKAEEAVQPVVVRRSVVAKSYKDRYAENAKTARGKKGVSKAIVADSCGDWLALELAYLCRPTPKHTFDLPLFEAICAKNGVDLSNLPRTSPGWQGRLRMNASQKLRVAVAMAGELVLPDDSKEVPPKSWIEKFV